MMAWSAALTMIIYLASAAAFMHVGRRVGQMPTLGPVNPSREAYRFWWYALASGAVVQATRKMLGLAGFRDLFIHLTLEQTYVLLTAVAATGLLIYVTLIRGRGDLVWPTVGAGVLFFLFFTGFTFYLAPTEVAMTVAGTSLVFTRSMNGVLLGALLTAFHLPPVVAALVYWRAGRERRSATDRYRVAMVSASIITWWGLAAGAAILGVLGAQGWEAVAEVLMGLAAVGVLMAYQPPTALRSRFGLTPTGRGRSPY